MRAVNSILPDFIVIGAMKSGTTTLYRYLRQHPEIGMTRDKETDYFVAEKNFGKGRDWYSGQFDASRRLHGEASPNYAKCTDFPGVPARIRAHCPEVRLIYVVRDPVDRAVSQYRHGWNMGALRHTPAQLPETHEYHHILDASHYGRQLAAYREHFPADQLLVLDFDRLVRTPQAAMDEVFGFLGVAPATLRDEGAQNSAGELSRIPPVILRLAQSPLGRASNRLIGRHTRDRVRRLLARGRQRQAPEIPAELRERMRREIAHDTAQFRRMTGLDFGHWSV